MMNLMEKKNRAVALAAKKWTLLVMVVAAMSMFPNHAFARKKITMIGPTGIKGYYAPPWPKPRTQIIVTAIEKGSPAEASDLKVGDVIIGAFKEKFPRHSRWGITAAIGRAEAAGGKLPLLLQDDREVEIKLKSLGPYSATAPYNCPKTDKMITEMAEMVLTSKYRSGTATRTGLLGLMATGEKKYLDLVAQLIHKGDLLDIDTKRIDDYLNGFGAHAFGYCGWYWGYNLITLGEYYLLTKDKLVLPAIHAYAYGLARGQDEGVGYWGHRMSRGKPRRAPGYGTMSQPTLSNLMGLIIAQKCGIKDPIIDQAVDKTYAVVEDLVGRGGFGYGSGGAYPEYFNNNGTSGSAAICLSLKGNQKGAAYFSQAAATSYDSMRSGHASSFFNPLWTPLGAGLSGPEVTKRFFKKAQWYFTEARHWKGGIPKADKVGMVAGQALLMYCLPRKVLLITGREASEDIYATPDEADLIMRRNKLVDEAKSFEELLPLLGDSFIQVRSQAATAVKGYLRTVRNNRKKKPEEFNAFMSKLLGHMESGNDELKISLMSILANAYGEIAAENIKVFVAPLRNKSEKFKIRHAAAKAFSMNALKDKGAPYFNDILRFLLEPRFEADPYGRVDYDIAKSIGEIIYRMKVKPLQNDEVDNELVFAAANKLLLHNDQQTRLFGAYLLEGITLEDFPKVAENLMYCLEGKQPGYHNYSRPLNPFGAEIVGKLGIKEGLDLLVNSMDYKAQGRFNFKYSVLEDVLPMYGGHAEPYLARLEGNKEMRGKIKSPEWKEMVEKIRADKKPRKLISLEEALRSGKSK